MKKTILAIASCVVLGLTSCDLDINKNPNAISSASNDNLFPTAEMNLAATMGVGFNMYGGYCAEMYGQNAGCSNYLKYSQFEVTASNTGSSYTQLFSRVLQQLKVVLEQSEDEPGTYLAAECLRAYTYQVLVDAYGEMPYSQALTDETQPEYEDGSVIYAGIIKELEDAKEGVSENAEVCSNITFGKSTASATTADQWIKFANTLLFKLYMRESAVADVKSKLAALIEENNFITEDVVYDKCWSNASGSYSPLYTESTGGSTLISADLALNYAVTATVADEGVGDTRLTAHWKKSDTSKMIGTVSGTNLSAELSGFKNQNFSMPNYTFNMPVYLLTVAELKFFFAEYYANEKLGNSMSTARDLYYDAVSQTFTTLGVDDVTAALTNSDNEHPNAPYKFDSSNPMKNIGIQKWIYLTSILNGFEGWCEIRRIGYPAFSDDVAQNIIENDIANLNETPGTYTAGTVYTPKNLYNAMPAKTLRQRFDYPSTSTDYNNNVPATKEPTVPVFWNNK